MKCNEGDNERIVRMLLGIVLIGVGISYQSFWVVLVAMLVLLSGATGWCPAYSIFKFSTVKPKT